MRTGISPAAVEYEKAWNTVVSSLPDWQKDIIVNNFSIIDGRHVYQNKHDNRIATDAAREARVLAESRLDGDN